jgi:glycosyltransferase involved in cell wall biosynthesis
MRILLDVTSACTSSLNTGIQKTIRGLFKALEPRAEVTPLVWNDWLRSYAQLTPRQRRFLTRPFSASSGTTAAPDRASRSLTARAAASLSALTHRFSWQPAAARDSLLIIPDVFRDHRSRVLPILLQRSGVPLVAFAHDVIPLTHPEISEHSRQSGFESYARALASAERVICVSNQTRTDLVRAWKRLNLGAVPTTVIPWPVHEHSPSPPPRRDPPQILCVSTLEKRKNHQTLFSAARQLHASGVRFELTLVGRTTKTWGPRVLTGMEGLRKDGVSVRWLKHVDETRLSELYQSCRFTIYPSLEEGFGLPIMESLACHRPCICGANGALGEIAEGGGCLQVDQTSAEALAKAMKTLLLDEGQYTDLVAQASRRKFGNWDGYAAALMNLIDRRPSSGS